MIEILDDIKDKIVGDEESSEETNETPETESSDDDLLSLKEQIAGQYVEHLKKQKEGGLSDMVIGEGNALKDYLVTEGIGDRISDAIKGELFGKIFDAVDSKSFTIGGVEYTSIFDYLKPMKERLDAAKTDVELNALLTEVQSLDQVDDSSAVGGSVAVGTGVVASGIALESSDLMNLKAESVDKYFSVLTGSTDVNIQNVDAQRTVEAMLTTCTFFGKNLTVNKYVATKLELIEKEIKDADIDYPIHDIGGYNRRNISGGNSLSYHALGLALDINPAKNPFTMTKKGRIPTDMPKEFVNIFRKHGFVWGGDRGKEGRKDKYKADAMHFQFGDEKYLKEEIQKDMSLKMVA